MMMNFHNRIKRLEQAAGVRGQRYVLTILAANRAELRRENEPLRDNEIAPGVMVFVYGEPLTQREREELIAKYGKEEEDANT